MAYDSNKTQKIVNEGPLTQARCEEVWAAAKRTNPIIPSDGLKDAMVSDEIDHVRKVWHSLPGVSTFLSAFEIIRYRKGWNGEDFSNET